MNSPYVPLDFDDPEATPEQEVQRLAKLKPLEYEREREDASKRLKVRASVLDKEVEKLRPRQDADEATGQSVVEELEPWGSPVYGASLINEVADNLRRHVVFTTPEQADAAALWAACTYAMDVWSLFPKMLVHSPTKRCGKTVFLEALEAHVNRGFLVSNISAASLFRVIEVDAPTILIDEADTFLRQNAEANGIINAGHRRRTARVVRTEDRNGEFITRSFSVWCAQVIAGIGQQRDTLVDRAISVGLRRRLPTEAVQKIPASFFEDMHNTRRKLARLAQDHRIALEASEIEAPEIGNDRATDNWTPLFRLAHVIGEDWPARCDAAMRAIEAEADEDEREPEAVRLMRDMVQIIDDAPAQLFVSEICGKLADMLDAPWAEYGPREKPISAQKIATLLRPYGVRPQRDRKGRTYRRTDLEQALARYMPSDPPERTVTTDIRHTSVTENPNDFNGRDGCDGCDGYLGRDGENRHKPSPDDLDPTDPEAWA